MIHVLYRVIQHDLVVSLFEGLHKRVGAFRHAVKVVRADSGFMPVVLVVRIANNEGATTEILLGHTETLVIAIRIIVNRYVRIAVQLIDVLLQNER